MDVSIVIINYKTPGLVNNCLESIKKHSEGFSYDVFLVDNSNDPKDFFQLQTIVAAFPFAEAINAEGNLGTSKANNLGAKRSDGEYILFLNSDTILRNNAILEMLDCIKKDSSIGAVGANLFNGSGQPTHSYLKKELTANRAKIGLCILAPLFARIGKNKEFNYSNNLLEIKGYICLAAELVSRRCFEEVGGFDEDIFMYSEDALFGHQLMMKGYRQISDPKAEITHLEGASDDSIYSPFKVTNMVNGSFLYHTKAFGREDAILYMKVMAKSLSRRARRNRMIGRRSIAENCLALSKTYWEKIRLENY